MNLELEINERLQVGGDKLVEHEDRHYHEEADEPDGQQGEVDTVPPLPTLRQPMDDHAHHKQGEHNPIVGQNVGDGRHIPMTADAVHHRLGRVPGGLVGHRWIQVGTRTEEQSRERDEYEGHEHIPAKIQPVDIPVGPDGRVDATDERAREEYA